jgi:D-alanine-D-alanine ligase
MSKTSGLTAFLMGGWTDEAEVSRNTAKACFDAAIAAGWDCELIEVDRDIANRLMQIRPARVFNALHGQMGEDGNIQGLLNLLNIPYTHSGVMASAIAMDKPMTKKVLAKSGIHFAEDIALTIHPDNRITTETSGAIVIKPRNTGSSFGVSIVHDGGEMPRADHWPQGTKLIAERFIPGRELTVSVLHGEPLTVTEISQDNAFYDYEAKYAAGGSQHQLPADIDSTTFATAMAWAALAHKELECRGVSRSDFRFDDDTGALVMLEINTQPGMTSTSLVPEQAQFKGISMTELMTSLLEAAQCD